MLISVLAVSDVVWQAIIAGIVTVVLSFFGILGTILQMRTTAAIKRAEESAQRGIQETKESLVETTAVQTQKIDCIAHDVTENKQTGAKIHALVNSAMTIQLRLTATALRTLANHTRSPEHIRDAEAAEKLLAEHVQQQATVDSAAATKTAEGDSR